MPNCTAALAQKLESYFQIKKLGSNWPTELLAGLATFLALSYIFVVNPAILASGGLPKSAVFFATVLVSGLATLAMGLFARQPFALAPGLEMNAYLAVVVIGGLNFSWPAALGLVFWSGVLMLLANLARLRTKIIDSIPTRLKTGLAATVGIFLVLIALKVGGLTAYAGVQIVGIGELTSSTAVVFYVGFLAALILHFGWPRAAVFGSVIIASVVAHVLQVGEAVQPVALSREMFAAVGALDLRVILQPASWGVILALFIIDFYGSIAKLIGLAQKTTLVNTAGELPRLGRALYVDGAATTLGAAVGTSNLTVYAESAVGIGAGGRTGVTAIVTGILMLLFLLLTPLVNLVPVAATTGALAFVGLSLLPRKKELANYTAAEMVAVAAMVGTAAYTFALDTAMLAGFGSYTAWLVLSGRTRELSWPLVISTLLLALGLWLR